jgi:epoxyqueuosine reductase
LPEAPRHHPSSPGAEGNASVGARHGAPYLSLGAMIIGMTISDILKKRALEIGFDLVGIAPITIWPDLEFSQQWFESGFGGEMEYLSNPKRADPRLILPSVQSVICLGLVYNAGLPYSMEVLAKQRPEGGRQKAESAHQDTRGRANTSMPNHASRDSKLETRGWISRYAWGRDYHRVMRDKLEQVRREIDTLAPGTETRIYVDTGPVVERAFARFSGIGWMGKNTCLINETKGSWFFLAVVLSSLALPPDLPAPDRCGSCTRCLEACPTGALVRPYVMDASRCIAYLTIEQKGSIPAELRPEIGLNVFGCDICQDVCPWNLPSHSPHPARPRGAATTKCADFQPLEIETGEKKCPENAGDLAPSLAATKTDSSLRCAPLRMTCHPERSEESVFSSQASKNSDVSGAERSGEEPNPSLFPGAPDAGNQSSRSVSLFNPPLRALASIDEESFHRAFSRSPVRRAKYRGWLRNLCVAMGNSEDTSLVPWLKWASKHTDGLIREHASWALDKLGSSKT